MSEIRFDESSWPILLVVYPRQYSRDALLVHLDQMGCYLERGERFGVVFDLRETRGLTAAEREDFGHFLNRVRERIGHHCVGASILARSSIHHAVLNTLGWLSCLPFEVRSHTLLTEALTWVGEQVKKKD